MFKPIALVITALLASGCVVNAEVPVSAQTNVNQVSGGGSVGGGVTSQDGTGSAIQPGSSARQGGSTTGTAGGATGSSADGRAQPVAKKLKFTKMPLETGGVIDWQARDFNHVYGVLGNKLTQTKDAGRTWQTTEIGKVALYTVFFHDESLGWVGGQNGVLFRTEDGGQTWSLADTGQSATIWDIVFTDADNGFMLTNRRLDSRFAVVQTRDGGKTWNNSSETIFDIVETGVFWDQDLKSIGHIKLPHLFLDKDNQAWLNEFRPGYQSLWYFHDGAFENVFQHDTVQEYVAPDRLYFMTFGSNGVGIASFTKDFITEEVIGPNFTTPSQIHRNLGLTNIVQSKEGVIRVFTKSDANKFLYLDSMDGGVSWTDATDVDGIVPTSIQAFDLDHYWGFEKGSLYRAGL